MSNEITSNDVPEEGDAPSAPSDNEAVRVSDSTPKFKRVELTNEQLENISLEDLRTSWKQQDSYINMIESLNSSYEGRLLVHFVIYCVIFARQVLKFYLTSCDLRTHICYIKEP